MSKSSQPWIAGAVAALSVCLAACSATGHESAKQPTEAASTTTTLSPALLNEAKEGSKIIPRIISAPFNYVQATASGETGAITPSIFTQMGAASAAVKNDFVIGYRQDYVTNPAYALANDPTEEGISITVLQFKTPGSATAYLASVRTNFLSLAAPIYRSFLSIPGAEQADYTKAMGGEYVHGVVMSKNQYFALFEYANYMKSSPPSEFPFWIAKQYSLL